MRALWLIGAGLMALVASEHAFIKVSPAAGQQQREVKSLLPREVEDLRHARGAAYTRVATLNGYPGPEELVEMAQDLGLSDDQLKAVEDIRLRLEIVATSLGTEILEIEGELDRLFTDRLATKPRVNSMVTVAGGLYATLRAVHLAAHIDATGVLHPWQMGRYNELRGYYIARATPTK